MIGPVCRWCARSARRARPLRQACRPDSRGGRRGRSEGDSLSAALAKHSAAFERGVREPGAHRRESAARSTGSWESNRRLPRRAEALRLKVEAALRSPTFVLTFAGLVLLAMALRSSPCLPRFYDVSAWPLPAPDPDPCSRPSGSLPEFPLFVVVVGLLALLSWSWSQTEQGATGCRAGSAYPSSGPDPDVCCDQDSPAPWASGPRVGTQILYASR